MNDSGWGVLLLSHRSPCLRYLALTKLLDRPDDDDEVAELDLLKGDDDQLSQTAALQRADGSWPGAATPWMLLRLSMLGIRESHPATRRGAEFLFSLQNGDGSWPIPGTAEEGKGYDMVPLQTALPLIGVASAGFATDPRSERAYEWLLAQRLDDGAWPTGLAGGTHGGVAGYRRLAHSRWGCRSNTTAALLALSFHPTRRREPAAARALDLVLGRETRERHQVGFEVARAMGYEPLQGFFTRFAKFDPALLLDLAAKVGSTTDDPRISDLVDWILSIQGPHGLWDYLPHPAASHWVTLYLLLSLRQLEANSSNGVAEALRTDAEPRTPCRPYPKRRKRH